MKIIIVQYVKIKTSHFTARKLNKLCKRPNS